MILRILVERQVLERTSEAARGPAVEYGPGPLLADWNNRACEGLGKIGE